MRPIRAESSRATDELSKLDVFAYAIVCAAVFSKEATRTIFMLRMLSPQRGKRTSRMLSETKG